MNHIKWHINEYHDNKPEVKFEESFVFRTNRVLQSNMLCPVCGSKLHSPTNMKRHLALVHFKDQIEMDLPPGNKCHICSKAFRSRYFLVRHAGSVHDMVCQYSDN